MKTIHTTENQTQIFFCRFPSSLAKLHFPQQHLGYSKGSSWAKSIRETAKCYRYQTGLGVANTAQSGSILRNRKRQAYMKLAYRYSLSDVSGGTVTCRTKHETQ
jgi:hypothetical protein